MTPAAHGNEASSTATIYTLTCLGLDGISKTKTATVTILFAFPEIEMLAFACQRFSEPHAFARARPAS